MNYTLKRNESNDLKDKYLFGLRWLSTRCSKPSTRQNKNGRCFTIEAKLSRKKIYITVKCRRELNFECTSTIKFYLKNFPLSEDIAEMTMPYDISSISRTALLYVRKHIENVTIPKVSQI